VAIDKQALQASLSGDFLALTIAAKAGDMGISGRADTIALRGDALRVNLLFKVTFGNEVVAIDAHMREADLDFSAAPQLFYAVTAKTSLVGSARKSVPGAKPTLTIAATWFTRRSAALFRRIPAGPRVSRDCANIDRLCDYATRRSKSQTTKLPDQGCLRHDLQR
jgi:hypothetical protein